MKLLLIVTVAFVGNCLAQRPPQIPEKPLPPKQIVEPYQDPNKCAFLVPKGGAPGTKFWTCGVPFKQPYCGSDVEIKHDCCPGFMKSDLVNGHCGEGECNWKHIHDHTKDYTAAKFSKILKKAGIPAMTDKTSTNVYTLFVPQSDKVLKEGEYDLTQASGSPHPVNMHVTEGRVYARDLKNGAMIKVANGDHKLKVTTYSNGLVFVECQALVEPDHEAKNGVIHHISGPIKPHVGSKFQRKTVLQTLQNNPETNAFYSDIPQDIRNMLDQDPESQWYTVFAPKNSAWKEAKQKFSGNVATLVKNHILNRMICAKAISRKATSLGPTMAKEYLGVDCKAPKSRSAIDACDVDIKFKQEDLMAGNGVVHVMDNALVPMGSMDAKQASECKSSSSDPKKSTKKYAELVKDCDLKMDPGSKYVVLVPSDEAFKKVQNGKYSDQYNKMDKCDVLKYHVLKADGSGDPPSIVNQKMFPTNYKSPKGSPEVVANIVKDRTGSKLYFNNAKADSVKPTPNKNGYMHVVDNVMVPPTNTMMDILSKRPDTKFVYNQLKKTGYGNELSSMGPKVLFLAPQNHGFGTRKEKKYGPDEMKEVLKMQTVKMNVWDGDSGELQRETVNKFDAVAQVGGKPVKLNVKRKLNGNTYIGYDGLPEKNWSMVVDNNLQASDGMVWVVDWPLPVKK